MNVSMLHDLDRKRCGDHMPTGPMAGTYFVVLEPGMAVEPDRLGADGTRCPNQVT